MRQGQEPNGGARLRRGRAGVLGGAVVLLACLALGSGPWVARALAEDSDQLRYYLGVRIGDSNPLTKAHDATGWSVGANLGRYLGADLAFDKYELFVDGSDGHKVGEVQVFSVLPEIRLRYPMLGDRLVPYLLAGAGLAIDHINDARVPSGWEGGGPTRTRLVGAVGGGVEYFLTDDMAFGVEGKYFMLGSATYQTATSQTRVHLDAGVLTFGMRFLYPELHPDEAAFTPQRFEPRVYVNVRAGGALMMKGKVFPGVKTSQSHPLFGSNFGRLYAATVGVSITPRIDLEASGSYNELSFVYPNGRHSEYATFPVLVQARLHALLENARLDPYVLAGVGPEFVEVNDPSGMGSLGVESSGVAVVGGLGGGIDYRLTRDISLGIESKYVISRGQTLRIGDGPELRGNLDRLLLSIGVRGYFATL